MSDIAKKLVGVFIPDGPPPKASTLAWAQAECRSGSLHEVLEEFAKAQDEPLDVSLAVVESVDHDGINGVVPCRMFDRESPSAFSTEVRFRISPSERRVERLAPQ
jgi:hypothetical protein